jgi:hypothetical protein
MSLAIKKASKKESKLRMALIGVSGSGKTYTSLAIGTELGQKVLVVDTERGSASKYADIFNFDVIELDDFAPLVFIEAIKLANANGYDCVILDSLSHAWMGRGGVLEMHDNASKRSHNSFAAWRDVTPQHNALVDAMLQSKCHVIVTLRAKTEYVQDKDEKTGKTSVRKVGLAPVQRDGLEYEFDVVAEVDIDNNFIVNKTRCSALSGKVFNRAGLTVAEILRSWLEVTPPTKINAPKEALKPVQATTPEDEFIGKIEQRLSQLGKADSSFNKWFQDEYQSTMNWREASASVLSELWEKVGKWKVK